jgi:hypothetical protein
VQEVRGELRHRLLGVLGDHVEQALDADGDVAGVAPDPAELVVEELDDLDVAEVAVAEAGGAPQRPAGEAAEVQRDAPAYSGASATAAPSRNVRVRAAIAPSATSGEGITPGHAFSLWLASTSFS